MYGASVLPPAESNTSRYKQSSENVRGWVIKFSRNDVAILSLFALKIVVISAGLID
jgi:hypothetical protein